MHHRNTSTLSSIGPSAEYQEVDLDEEWSELLREVNELLVSKQRAPVQTAKCEGAAGMCSITCGLSAQRAAAARPRAHAILRFTRRERATVINSLLVSTTTRSREDCVRTAAIDMLTFRKMHGQTAGA